jgi:hypothetical protein
VESTNGQTEESMMVSGRITRWRVMVSSHGLMAEGTKENTLMTRRKETESSTGQTEESMRESGRTANSTALESIHQLLVKQRRENGMKARESIGLIDRNEENF